MVGAEITVSSPSLKEFLPNKEVIGNVDYKFEKNPLKAVQNADVIYTDSWMSYHIPKAREKWRITMLKPYQVTMKLMNLSKKALFMHCLPATRGHEVTDEVIDSKKSIVYDQAENRVYAEEAILLMLLKKG